MNIFMVFFKSNIWYKIVFIIVENFVNKFEIFDIVFNYKYYLIFLYLIYDIWFYNFVNLEEKRMSSVVYELDNNFIIFNIC